MLKSDRGEKHRFSENYYLKAFFTGLALSFVIFLPFIIRDGGRFLFYGDFNVQQVSFYRLAHDAIRNGNTGWSHTTDLGANFIGSYSFYLLGSPFFWLTIPFPSEWLQYLMGPLLILKFACATLTSFIYIRRYVRNENAALIGSLLYAFSGFSIYNIFFNHFHEAIVFFPLLLSALDEYMYSRRRGIFAIAVAACAVVNYYFFVGMVCFCVIYFFLRLLSHSWRINLKDFGLLALEAVLGLGVSFFLLLPSVYCVVQNSRVSNPISGWNALLYSNTQRYLHIIECFFFPPDLPARPNFTPDSESKWASLGAWLPLFGMTGVIGYLQTRKSTWVRKMLYILFMMALIPGFNAAFQLFNASYYARWYYMLTLVMALATALALENEKVRWRRAICLNTAVTVFIAVAVGCCPTFKSKEGGGYNITFGLEKYPTRFWSYVAISVLCMALMMYIFAFFAKNRNTLIKSLRVVLSLVIVVYSVFFIAIGKIQSTDPYEHIIPYALNGGKDIPFKSEDLDKVRSDFYESLDNSAMFWEIPSIQAFHSIVPGSIMDFYSFIGVKRDVGSRPDSSHYALRALTSVKYLFDDEDDDDSFSPDLSAENAAMPGWMFWGTANGFDIWENEYFIGMGFTYDSYILYSEAEKLGEAERELLMLKAMVVPDEKEYLVDDYLLHFDLDEAVFDYNEYTRDCQQRADLKCNSFAYTDRGFEAAISTEEESVVFFSVPNESGWKASVNGETVEIISANVGFMAVKVPSGDNVNIVFTYTTPGLSDGIAIAVISFALLIAYIILVRIVEKKKTTPETSDHAAIFRMAKFSSYAKKHNTEFLTRYKGKYMLMKRTVRKGD
ncbi:MAG: YfhO family protein [Clostridia bacterium]|nr:YfhO family protein [Clostridia bacterium]